MGPQEDYIETVFTCEGDYDDPHLQDRLKDFQTSLKDLLLTDTNKLILKKVEPWNSVRVTFKIPREAAVRLKQLAQQGNTTLRDLGVLAVQIQDQHISLTIAGRNNERTQLVFRTAESVSATTPSVSVFDTNSPSLEELGPQGPGPSHVEATSKNIEDYLRQGSSIIDSILHQQQANERMHIPGDSAKGKVNNILSTFSEPGRQFQFPPPMSSHHGIPASTSPSTSALSPNRGAGQKFPQVPGLPPGLPPGMPPGPRHTLDNLPPPPPYPQGSSYLNNYQKLRLGNPGASPLLVNLLQNDPNFSNLIATGQLPQSLDPDSLQPPVKKKRKPRRPREKKSVDGNAPVTSVPTPAVSGTAVETPMMTSVPATTSTTTSFVNHGVTPSVKEHNFHNPQAMHNINVQVRTEQSVSLTSPVLQKKIDESDTAGKIINPVTGVLEPMENLSDTSPTKSDSDKHSPRSLGQKVNINKKGESVGEVPDSVEQNSDGHQGRNVTVNQGVQKSLIEHSNSGSAPQLGHSSKDFNSSQFGLLQLKHKEAAKNDIVVKPHIKNNIIPSVGKLEVEQKVPNSISEHQLASVERKCDRLALPEVSTPLETVKQDGLPQESEVKSIPSQLLNKPLLQVKHNNASGRPSGSPDSNGDSECSTQSINLDTQNGSEPGGQAGPQSDQRLYNHDSGVGSCSERSEDTPSEPGDSDFKSGNTSSFECAKTTVLHVDTVKQAPPTSKVMTVGYTVSDTQIDHKNHKIVSPYLGTEKLNSKFEQSKIKSDKLETFPTSQSQVLHWASKEQTHTTNNVDMILKHAVHERNAKSPKLSTSLPGVSSQGLDGPVNSMQGNSDLSMQKKKSSPRNSPRGSPRSASSPRNPSSPRGSPRGGEATHGGQSRQSFLTAQDFSTHLPAGESQNKLQYSESGRSPHSEQRKSPFNMLLTSHQGSSITSKSNITGGFVGGSENVRHDYHHVGVGVESVRMSPQCNIDNIAILKSLEAHPLSQLSNLAASKDASLLQKLEELRPLFQKLHQQQQHQVSVAPAGTNGIENFNHASRSPGPHGSLPKSLGLYTRLADTHSVFENTTLPNNVHSSVTNVLSVSDRDNISVNYASSKGNKVSPDELKGVSSSGTVRRSSPGAATSNSLPFNNPFDSSLPPPKRLTESVQKLFPLPLDNSLPHANRRSPSNCATSTRSSVGLNVSPPVSSPRGSTSGCKTPVSEIASFDLDSITPSIMGLGLDLHTDHLVNRLQTTAITIPDNLNIPVQTSVDSKQTQGPYRSSIVQTKSVPVITGPIPSHKTFVGETVMNSSSNSALTLDGKVKSVVNSSENTELKSVMCNNENEMAVTVACTSAGLVPAGPISHNVRYPMNKQVEKPKSPYQQMGLSEMLQETARPHSVSMGRQSPHCPTQKPVQNPPHLVPKSEPDIKIPSSLTDSINQNDEAQLKKESGSVQIPKQKTNCDSPRSLVTEASSGTDNSDIPKLVRQTNISAGIEKYSVSSQNSDAKTNSVSGEPEKSVDGQTMCSFNSVPPVLTAVSEIALKPKTDETDTSSKSNGKVSKEPGAVSSSLAGSVASTSAGGDKPVGTIGNHDGKLVAEVNELSPSGAVPVINTPDGIGESLVQNSVSDDADSTDHHLSAKSSKTPKKHSVALDGTEEKIDDQDMAPRQLRSRKRNNTGENETSGVPEEPKRLKLDGSIDTGPKVDSAKEIKVTTGVKHVVVHNANVTSDVTKDADENNTQSDSVKSLRTRTNMKNLPNEEKDSKVKLPSGRDSRKDGKVATGKLVPDKKVEQIKMDDSKKNPPNRRNRQSPSTEKQGAAVNREKSPVRVSRTRGRNSPVVVENADESQENKRTTRSAKSKVEPAAQPSSKALTANKRRRTSQDHR